MASRRKQQEAFLVEFSNLPHDPIAQRCFLDKWEGYIPKEFLADSPLSRLALEMDEKVSREAIASPTSQADVEEYSLAHLNELSYMLRKAWTERTIERRQYFAHEVSRRFARMYFSDPSEHPPWSNFERAMGHFSTILERTRRCEHANCPLPYYIAPNRKPRKYCELKWKDPTSGELTTCTMVMRKASRLKSWDKHKEKHLAERKSARRKQAQRRHINGKR
jgi:hypothetical protein